MYTVLLEKHAKIWKDLLELYLPFEGKTKPRIIDFTAGCVAKGSLISTAQGYIPIEEVKDDYQVYSFNNGQFTLETVSRAVYSGYKTVYQVRTKHRDLGVTDIHPLLVLKHHGRHVKKTLAWCQMKDLKVGDQIILSKNLNASGTPYRVKAPIISYEPHPNPKFSNLVDVHEKNAKDITVPDIANEDFCRLWGFMLGDGWVLKHRVAFALSDYPELNKKYELLVSNLFAVSGYETKIKQYVVDSLRLAELFRTNGWINGAHVKRIPHWALLLPRPQRIAMIEGFTDADGWEHEYEDSFGLSSCNKELLNDLRLLIHSVGWQAGHVNRCAPKKKPIYIKDRLIKPGEAYYLNYSKSIINNGQDKRYNYGRLFDTENFIVETILSIEETGLKDVYDLTIPSTENFIANGIIAHNTKATWWDLLEQICSCCKTLHYDVIFCDRDPLWLHEGELKTQYFDEEVSKLSRTKKWGVLTETEIKIEATRRVNERISKSIDILRDIIVKDIDFDSYKELGVFDAGFADFPYLIGRSNAFNYNKPGVVSHSQGLSQGMTGPRSWSTSGLETYVANPNVEAFNNRVKKLNVKASEVIKPNGFLFIKIMNPRHNNQLINHDVTFINELTNFVCIDRATYIRSGATTWTINGHMQNLTGSWMVFQRKEVSV